MTSKFVSLEESPAISCVVVRGADDIRQLIAKLYEQKPKPDMAYGISDMDMLEEHFPEFRFSAGNQARIAAGVPSQALYTSSMGPVYTQLDHLLLRESRFLPAEILRSCADTTIVGDTVVFMSIDPSTKQPVALAIKSALVAAQMTGYFSILWSLAATKPQN